MPVAEYVREGKKEPGQAFLSKGGFLNSHRCGERGKGKRA